jgi:acyl-CoA reductase-like NAD-dependent aldehyde dehydrogenase
MVELRSLLNEPVSAGTPLSWSQRDPTQPEVILAVAQAAYPEIEAAVRGSAGAFEGGCQQVALAWDKIKSSREDLLKSLSIEQGRSREDVGREWAALERVVAVWLESGIDLGRDRWEPRGCTVVLLSSSWPLFHSVKFLLAAWLGGNPVILKPSEQASITVHRMVETLRAAGESFHSVQCLVGDREVGRRLACHEGVETVIFMGTFENGMRVRQDTLSRPAKEVLLHLGNKNVTVFGEHPDEDSLDRSCADLVDDAFSGAGQDCKSVSLLFLPSRESEFVIERIHARARSFKIGDPREGAWMGPLQDPSRLDRYLKFIGISEREGATVIMRGKPLPGPGKSWCVAPSLSLYPEMRAEDVRKSVVLQTEILAPMISILPYRDNSHLIALLSSLNHAHTCSLRGGGLPDRSEIPFSRVISDVPLLSVDPAVSVHYRKRNGNHALTGAEMPFQLVRRHLK